MTCQCETCAPIDYRVKAEREKRAEELFLSFLTKEQKESLAECGFFEVTGSDGDIYRIFTYSHSGNILWLRPPGVGRYICCYPQRPMSGYLPRFDRILGQMLAIQTDAKNFLKVAYSA